MLSIAPGGGTYLGVFTSALGVENRDFENNAGTNPAIVHVNVDWTTPAGDGTSRLIGFDEEHPDVGTSVAELVEESARANQVVAISWDPLSIETTDPGMYDGSTVPEITLQQILDGEFDSFIRDVARQVAAMDTPVLMNLFGESDAMSLFGYGADGTSYMETQDDQTGLYGDPSIADGPERIRDVFRRVIDLFREEGADNADWFMYLSTGALNDPDAIHPSEYYPGDDYIDWVGQSVYIEGPAELAASLDAGYAAWGEVTQRPFFIPEMGLTGTDNANALAETLDALSNYARVQAVTLTDFAAAETEYGVPRLGARDGDWNAIANSTGYLNEVLVVEDGAPALPISDWRDTTGRDQNDNLFLGTDGDDVLIGSTGADQMVGGNGNDIYVVDDSADEITELQDGGYDVVIATDDFSLTEMTEMLILEGSSGLSGTGNAGANSLIGNIGGNWLQGEGGSDTLDGGAGSDTLLGGTGDDVYMTDNLDDVVFEGAGEGNDLVLSTVGMALGANIETLVLQGTADLWGAGSEQANTLVGNVGANILAGAGGDDSILAGDGDDTIDGGIGNDILEGEDGNDWLFGDLGQDVLNGGAGDDILIFSDGSDLAIGGAGADVFLFLPSTGLGTVQDFTVGEDRLDLSSFGLAGLADVSARATAVDGGTYLAMDDGSQLFLAGVALSMLTENDIIF